MTRATLTWIEPFGDGQDPEVPGFARNVTVVGHRGFGKEDQGYKPDSEQRQD